ncbi:hypothetical protein LOC51_37305 [Rubrivivax sp. JA1024]|nr:hypothetical protein [Rubrivivax sp. JA1024]
MAARQRSNLPCGRRTAPRMRGRGVVSRPEQRKDPDLAEQVARVGRLIDGYQSSYGMELLASVHWVATREEGVTSPDDALAAVQAWNDRKRRLMKREHVAAAWQRLQDEGWLKPLAEGPMAAQAISA